MKKKTKLAITFLSAITLFSCGNTNSESNAESNSQKASETAKPTESTAPTTSDTGKVSASDTSKDSDITTEKKDTDKESVTPALTEIAVTGTISHFIDGLIDDAFVSIDGKEVNTAEDGTFTIEKVTVSDTMTLKIEKDGYVDKYVTLPAKEDLTETVNLGTIELAKDYVSFGKLTEKTWTNYEAFEFSTTRDKDNLYVKADANNGVFFSSGRNSKLETYISVGEVASTRDGNVYKIVLDSAKSFSYENCGGKTITDTPSYEETHDDTSTSIAFTIPFSMLGITANDILGLNLGVWSETDSDWAPMEDLTKGSIHAVETPSSYVRADKENVIFLNSKNEYYVPPTYDKDELTKGYPFQTATPSLTNKSEVADDIYMKYTKTETGFDFSFLLFGKMEGNEHLKLIFHTDDDNKTGWGTCSSDLFVQLDTTKARKKTGITSFWSYSDFASDDTETNHTPTYREDESGYYELGWSIDFTEIPDYSASGKVSLYCMEFAGSDIYDATLPENGMRVNGTALGDPANQGCYYILQEKVHDMDTTGYPYEISRNNSNIFLKTERNEEGILLSFISDSSGLTDNDFLRFIVHSGTDTTGGWNLNTTDVTFIIRNNSAKLATGKSSFWDNEKDANPFGADTETLNAPVYTKTEKYWTLTFQIDGSETGVADYTSDTALKGMAWEFKNGGIINGNTHYKDNKAIGDTALQSNYFAI